MTKLSFLSFFLLLFSSLSLMAQSDESNFLEEDAILQTGSGDLYGTLLAPKTEGQVPVVLIIAGSGPTDRNGNNSVMKNNSLKLIADSLAQAGIASLRYDKRAVAASLAAAKAEIDLRFEHYVEDAAGWIRQLRADERFSKVIVAGHSEGSLIGMIAARKTEANGFISIAGAGKNAADALRDQIAANSPVATPITDPIIDSLEAGKTVDEINPMLISLFRPSVQPYLISWFKYDPQEEIKKLVIPVLLLQGTTDIQIPLEQAELLAQAKEDATLVVIEGMNHILKEAPMDRTKNIATYNDPELPLKPGLMEAILEYISGLE